MTDKREALRSMLNNLINDRNEEAKADFHNFVTAKSREVTGLAGQPEVVEDPVDGEETPPVDAAPASDDAPAGDPVEAPAVAAAAE